MRRGFLIPGGEVLVAAFSPDGATAATVGIYYEKTVRILDVVTGKELRTLEHPKAIRSLAFTPDGKALAAGCDDNGIYLWQIAARERPRVFLGHEDSERWRDASGLRYLAFSPSGETLASAGKDDTVRLWNVTTGQQRLRLTEVQSPITKLVFSPNGHTLAASTEDDEIRFWDLAACRELGRLHVGRFGVNSLAFSRDGRMLAWGGGDKDVHLWDLATRQETLRLAGHIGPISCLTFSPDGKRLASGSEDTTVLIWDVHSPIAKELSRATALQASDLEHLWEDLADGDASKAGRALWVMVAGGNPSVYFLKKHVRPAPMIDLAHMNRLVGDLDSNRFETREKASADLEKLGELAEPTLRGVLIGHSSAEVQGRAKRLLEKLDGPITRPDQLRALRVVEVLEHIGSSDARDLLQALAQGAPQARLTREAKQALDRLNRLPPRK